MLFLASSTTSHLFTGYKQQIQIPKHSAACSMLCGSCGCGYRADNGAGCGGFAYGSGALGLLCGKRKSKQS